MPLVDFEIIDTVKTPEGCIHLSAHTLTDGSVAYDIHFYASQHGEQDVLVYILAPANKKKAFAMFEDIKNSV
jgi:hypothetical protein